jgi:CheY-like chemotaxis protein
MGSVTSDKTILVVEDDVDALTALTGLLQALGYHVVAAKNGLEALQILRTGFRPQLIFLDLMMPLMNGWQFVEERQKDPELSSIPVIVFTADKNANGGLRSSGAVADFLIKPATLQELQSKLARFFP